MGEEWKDRDAKERMRRVGKGRAGSRGHLGGRGENREGGVGWRNVGGRREKREDRVREGVSGK